MAELERELDYLERREQRERMMARNASGRRAKDAHACLARFYAARRSDLIGVPLAAAPVRASALLDTLLPWAQRLLTRRPEEPAPAREPL